MAVFQTGCDELATLVESSSGCMLADAPNFNEAALLPCTTECLGDQTGSNCCCEEIAYGCMDATAVNYSEISNAPCSALINGVEISNSCCITEEKGCMDDQATNYDALANTDDGNCEYTTVGATDADGNAVLDENGEALLITPGCMNPDACNFIAVADADCNAGNASISGSEWTRNDDCCNMTKNASCYLDLNNNGYYEEVNSSANLCNCGELGVGWVSEDNVAENMEVQGCMSPTMDGQPCAEYNPVANVDNGGCCQEEFSFEDFADFDESSLDFMGVFNVDYMYGMLNTAGECVADTMYEGMDMGGPNMAQITLGAPNTSGEAQMQYFEVYQDKFGDRTEWETHVPSQNTEDKCSDFAEENGSDYSYCANWGFDYENCEDFGIQADCPADKCQWETKFCHPTFEGQPCETYMNDMDCYDNDCEWGADPLNPAGGHCFTPFDEPWMHCWDLDEYDCEMSPDCELEGSDDFGGDFGEEDCMMDCPIYPDDMNWTQAGECEWLSGMISTDCLSDCDAEISGMAEWLKMDHHMSCAPGSEDCMGFLGDDGQGECSYSCPEMYDNICDYNGDVPSDFSTCCPGFDTASCPVEVEENIFVDQGDLDYCMSWEAGLTYGNCQGCSIKQIANVYSSHIATQTGTADTTMTDTTMTDTYISFPVNASEVAMNDSVNYGHFCGWMDKAVSENKFNYCDGNVQDLMYDLFDDCKACDSNSAQGFQVNAADMTCHAGVFGSGNFAAVDCSQYTDGSACKTMTEHGQCICDQDCEWHPNPPNADGTPSQSGSCTDFGIDENFIGGPACLGDCPESTWDWGTQIPEDSPQEFCTYIAPLYEGTCTDDCSGQEGMINCFGHMCVGCLEMGNGMCDIMFGNDSDTLSFVTEKLIKANKPKNSGLARASTCETGYLEDCSGDGDCCDELWLGDGYEDCADQAFGCDLSCYDNDGGDCEADFGEQACIPSSECFDFDYEGPCRQNNCAWVNDPFSNESHCEPMPSFNPNACGGKPQTDCSQDEACQWNATAGPNDPANFEPHCGPKAPDDCFAFNSASECDASISCEWEAPDWMDDWQTGVCFSNNPCAKPENNDPDMCDSDPMCNWDWEYYECVESGGGNNFCDCVVSHTQRTCNDMNGSWQLPDWAEDCTGDCAWIEYECMVSMDPQDCYSQDENFDPCMQFYQGSNQNTYWDDDTAVCVNEFSFSSAGTWGLGEGCLEIAWADTPEPVCTDPVLQTEDTCYCFDCDWNDAGGDCIGIEYDGMGRVTDQAKMRNFQEMIYQLSGSSGDGDCIDYVMDGDEIHLIQIDEEYGQCEIIVLSPVTSGS